MDLWTQTVDTLRELVPPYDFTHWIRPIECTHIDNERAEITLSVPDESHGRWVKDHFLSTIRNALKQCTSKGYEIRIQSDTPGKEVVEQPHIKKAKPFKSFVPRYRFDQFVHGPNNQFAMTAARAVSEQPGVRYNPLFIYGGVGLGKTHLLHAIAHHIGQIHPEKHVVYVSSESYVNDLISAIRSNGMDKFRLKYRDQCDVLLIDDIQFIAGKDRTQEEFFHMFNTLHSFGKQIVLTSDQLPRSIPDLEDRLKSRFEWGLIADIKPPSFETRAAIVTVKAEEKGIFLPEEVAMFLARHVSRNVRELEGALMRLVATSQMFGTSITIQMTRDILSELVDKTLAYVSIPSIIKAVSDEFDLTAQDLKGPRRQRHITIPRQVAMHLARQLTKSSLPQIGAAFGGRDHTTVINGLKRVELLKSADPNLKRRIDGLFKQLRP